MGLEIRTATAEDQAFIAWTMLTAARSHLRRGFWDVLVPDAALREPLLHALAVHPAGCHCHHDGFLVATLEGEPVGALSGYEPLIKTDARFRRALVGSLADLGADLDGLDEMELRAQPFTLCQPEFPDDAWIVEWVAVRPERRGGGVVDALLEAILSRGRERGYTQAQLAYMLGNEPAERAYARHGFQVVAARSHPSMQHTLGSPGVGRMRAAL